MGKLFGDSKFVTALIDAGATTALLIVGRFVSPTDAELVKTVVVLWQPIFVSLILSGAYVEVKAGEALARIEEARIYAASKKENK